MVFRQADLTPCGVLFDVFKRKGGISHKELAGLILSDRPLSDGRSASSRAADRTWLSPQMKPVQGYEGTCRRPHVALALHCACAGRFAPAWLFPRLGARGPADYEQVAPARAAQHDVREDHRPGVR